MRGNLRLAWRHARGHEEGQATFSIAALALTSIGGGAALLAAVAVFLALEP